MIAATEAMLTMCAWLRIAFHPIDHRVATVDRPTQIDADNELPVGERQLADLASHADARVVDEQIELRPHQLQAIAKMRRSFGARNIQILDLPPAAGRFDERQRFPVAQVVDIGQGNLPALLRQGQRNRSPQVLPRCRLQLPFVVVPSRVVNSI